MELSHPTESHQELAQNDHGENDLDAEGTTPDESLNNNDEDGADEAPAFARVQ